MNDIRFDVRYEDKEQKNISAPGSMILGEVLMQLADKQFLPAGRAYVVKKTDSDEALDQSKTLEECGIKDGDILDVSTASKAGSR